MLHFFDNDCVGEKVKKIITRQRRDRVRGAIVGAAIGDALGMPAEGFHPRSIKKYYGKIREFRNPNPEKSFHKLRKGQWTDDTQLMLAIGESIVDKKCIDYYDIAKRHVELYNEKRGWGKSTRQSVERMLGGMNWWEAGEPNGAGNGPPMKIAPLGILYEKYPEFDVNTAIINISRMTHQDPRPAIAAILQAQAVRIALNGTVRDIKFYLRESYKLAKKVEEGFFGGEKVNRLSIVIKKAFLLKNLGPTVLRKRIGARCYINQSFPLTHVMVYKYCFNSALCLKKIVNLGGDADTTGAMAGAIVGALNGFSSFPEKWIEELEQSERLLELADNLWRLTI